MIPVFRNQMLFHVRQIWLFGTNAFFDTQWSTTMNVKVELVPTALQWWQTPLPVWMSFTSATSCFYNTPLIHCNNSQHKYSTIVIHKYSIQDLCMCYKHNKKFSLHCTVDIVWPAAQWAGFLWPVCLLGRFVGGSNVLGALVLVVRRVEVAWLSTDEIKGGIKSGRHSGEMYICFIFSSLTLDKLRDYVS